MLWLLLSCQSCSTDTGCSCQTKPPAQQGKAHAPALPIADATETADASVPACQDEVAECEQTCALEQQLDDDSDGDSNGSDSDDLILSEKYQQPSQPSHPLLCQQSAAAGDSPCVTWETIVAFAPYAHLHPQDRFRPVAMEQLLADAQQQPTDREELPTSLQPQTAFTLEPNLRLLLDERFGEDYTPTPANQVPFYVSLQSNQPGSIDITYWLLFAYNGPQMVLLSLLGESTLLQLAKFAEHQGDIESITIRLEWPQHNVLHVRTEQHGMSQYHTAAQVYWTEHHPHIDVALHSHATYPSSYPFGSQQHVLISKTFAKQRVEFVDVTDSNGELWHDDQSLQQQQALVLIGLDDAGLAFAEQHWVRFAGSLGRHQQNYLNKITTLQGESPAMGVETIIHVLTKSAELLGFLEPFLQASGPPGFARRSRIWLHPEQAPIALLQEPSTFLGGLPSSNHATTPAPAAEASAGLPTEQLIESLILAASATCTPDGHEQHEDRPPAAQQQGALQDMEHAPIDQASELE